MIKAMGYTNIETGFIVALPYLLAMGAGILLWGLGFAAVNSMQQGRLVAAAPELSGVSVALNTSALYVGQAVGSGLGGTLFAHDLAPVTGYVAIGFFVVALVAIGLSRSAGQRPA